MGQYFLTVNLDKKEYISPHTLGAGLKLWEQAGRWPSPGSALLFLLASSNGKGGGDFADDPLIGSWCGDRIAVVGDYTEPGEIPGESEAELIYSKCTDGEYKNISLDVAAVLEREYNIKFEGGGWRSYKELLVRD